MAGPSLTAQIWVDVRTFDSSRWQAPAMGQRNLGRFAGAAVIITGGAHGIGRACAARLAEEGAHIVVADLDQTAAQQVASGLAPKDHSHVPVWLDVTDASSVEGAFAEAISGLGGIDVLIRTSPAATQITARSRRRPTRSGSR
jgi:NAD(P)-dependent dehydrogenase (short-subunit alcohol dehydrogenase family)